MANDGFAINFAPSRPGIFPGLAPVAYFALLLLFFVTLRPFTPPIEVAGIPVLSASANGDTLREICYLGAFAAILFAALRARGVAAFAAVPVMLGLLLVWCLASALWADASGVAFRRASLAVIVVLSALLSVETIGSERAFLILRILLALVLVVNWVSIPLVHTAIHLPGEMDPGLVGDWRGLYAQKNTAGAVSAITVMLFLFSKTGARNWIGILVALAAAGFLVMTRSKTSLGFLPVALGAGVLYRLGWRRGIDRAIIVTAGILLLCGIAAFAAIESGLITRILEDPAEFTGRTDIWQAEFGYIRDHALLGSGFGTLSDTGQLSPLHNYVSRGWVEIIGDSHSGYLQLLVTLGAVGFALAMLALLVWPLRRFWPLENPHGASRALLFALFVFIMLHNLLETDFLQADNGVWLVLLLVIASLREMDKSLTPPR